MITHEKATDKNIITKQVVINTPTSARLLPITADEKVIDEIQQALNELKRLKKFKETFDNYELVKKQDFIAYENWIECEKELEELKQEVIARQETENSLTQWVADLTTELTELKSWRDELSGTIQDLISKAKHWEEKENKTDFEKGIARGYKTMLHQLLVGIDFDKEIENDKKIKN